ncbi:hypothetical protein OCU04_001193 [Sclerotinia nivalis]|uniref:Uncharacterized protein n=1 Tax=Sclerotinia nivalis TaxID=352851 RepID=A0A9X0DQX4_9HELO|nr:hypothetical protein OCU04_001193 [Sclerotinia nivalis]
MEARLMYITSALILPAGAKQKVSHFRNNKHFSNLSKRRSGTNHPRNAPPSSFPNEGIDRFQVPFWRVALTSLGSLENPLDASHTFPSSNAKSGSLPVGAYNFTTFLPYFAFGIADSYEDCWAISECCGRLLKN